MRRALVAAAPLVALALALALAAPAGAAIPNCTGTPERPSGFTCAEAVQYALDYPYATERTSFLFVDGVGYPYVRVTRDLTGDSTVRVAGRVITARALLAQLGLARVARRPRTPFIAYGANRNPDSLRRKFVLPGWRPHVIIPTLKATLHDHAIVWAPDIYAYGGLPSTIVSSPGTTSEVWINWMDEATIRQMNATEQVGENYAVGRLVGARIDVAGPPIGSPMVYDDCHGAMDVGGLHRVRAIRTTGNPYPPADEAEAIRLIAPLIGAPTDPLAFVARVARSPSLQAEWTERMAPYGVRLPLPLFEPQVACGG